ncbi:hypothetical protein KGY47_02255 [Candidatus Bipolaricaulota bacterium]|nr:hypothetical protein [Candidatus Bipolaricaulota bacterium]MBS3813904.1 hypothetical protein [Candidatus Bipolaricaulota bacterium]MBS3825561.1 hypothetical protein [Candidatus Bipolaricaulota bacterium]
MTSISTRAGLFLFVLMLLLTLPAFAQDQAEEEAPSVTEEEIAKLREEVKGLGDQLEALSSDKGELEEQVATNQASIAELKQTQKDILSSVDNLRESLKSQEDQLEKLSKLERVLAALQGDMKSLTNKLDRLDQGAAGEQEKIRELENNYKSLLEETQEVRKELSGIGDNLKNIRENSFDNEKKLADIEEEYQASARRNLLFAATGIVVGLLGIALYWAG